MQKIILWRFPGPVRWTKSVLQFLYLLQSTFCMNGVNFQKDKKQIVPVPCLLPVLYTDDVSPCRRYFSAYRCAVLWWCGVVVLVVVVISSRPVSGG